MVEPQMLNEIRFEDVSQDELECLRFKYGRVIQSAEVWQTLIHLAGLPKDRALKIRGAQTPNYLPCVRSAIKRRWPHLRVRQMHGVVLIYPKA